LYVTAQTNKYLTLDTSNIINLTRLIDNINVFNSTFKNNAKSSIFDITLGFKTIKKIINDNKYLIILTPYLLLFILSKILVEDNNIEDNYIDPYFPDNSTGEQLNYPKFEIENFSEDTYIKPNIKNERIENQNPVINTGESDELYE